MRVSALRSLIVVSIACLPAMAAAQAPLEDVFWIGTSQDIYKLDRFGLLRGSFPQTPTGGGPIRRAPNGDLWGCLRVPPGIQIWDRDGRPLQRVALGAEVRGLIFDQRGDAWVIPRGTNTYFVEQRIPTGHLFRTIRLPGTPTAITIDSAGRVWIAQDNTPAPFLSFIDPVTLQVSTVTLPARLGSVHVLAADHRGILPSHVWVGGGSNELCEVDERGNVVGLYPIGNILAQPIHEIRVGPRGDLLLLVSYDLWRFDTASRSARLVLSPAVFGVTHDALGGIWARNAGYVHRLVDDRFVDVSVFPLNHFYLGTDMGLHHALVVDPSGDLDGDGRPNAHEVQVGTNPYDAQSNGAIHLETPRVSYRGADNVEFRLRGAGGQAFLFYATDYLTGQPPAPAFAGAPRLPPGKLLPLSTLASVPGTVRLPVPNDPRLAGIMLCAQAVHLAGPPAFSNHTCVRIPKSPLRQIVETFDDEMQLDRRVSSGTWSGGRALPGRLGGSGLHGSFDPTLGVDLGNGAWLWNTDDMTIPASRTLFGVPIRVTDGRFEFTDFVVPPGTTVVFRGSKPPIIRVRGLCAIDGCIDLHGGDVNAMHNGKNSTLSGGVFTPGRGEPGGEAGAGGGRGGDGAFACDGRGNPAQPQFNAFDGFDGGDVSVPAGHAYAAQAPGTGGRGSVLFPPHGDERRLIHDVLGVYCSETTAGAGGGGGHRQSGGTGRAIEGGSVSGMPPPKHERPVLGPDAPGGHAFPLLPLPAGVESIDHFAVGGGGGGGGGSHALFAHSSSGTDPFKFWSGVGGGGGGGAIAIRAGGDITMRSGGFVDASGGSGGPTANSFRIGITGAPAPGGGGAGGAVLLQVAGSVALGGGVEVCGGEPSELTPRGVFEADARGGAGSDGLIRLEVPQADPPASLLGTTCPAARPGDVVQLVDSDNVVGCQSLWYPTRGGTSLPEFLYYELDAAVNGVPVTYTDAPGPSFNPTRFGSPVRLYVQGVLLHWTTGLPVSEPGPWRELVSGRHGQPSINDDSANGLRFLLLFDRSVSKDVAALELRIFHGDH